jgi:hypothetical protein
MDHIIKIDDLAVALFQDPPRWKSGGIGRTPPGPETSGIRTGGKKIPMASLKIWHDPPRISGLLLHDANEGNVWECIGMSWFVVN